MLPTVLNAAEYLLPSSLLTGTVGQRTALIFEGKQISYADLLRRVNEASRFFRGLHLAPRDRMALLLYDSPDFMSVFLGAMKAGLVPALLSTFLGEREIEYILNHCGARVVIGELDQIERVKRVRERLTKLEKIITRSAQERENPWCSDPNALREDFTPPSTRPGDPAFMLYTSGSTGEPKGVVHAHQDIPATIESFAKHVLPLTLEDKLYSTSKLFFAYGLGNSLSFPLSARASVVLLSERPTPAHVARILREHRPTVFFSVPAMYRALLESDQTQGRLDMSSVRFCVSAGEALPAPVFDEWRKRFHLEILDGMGTTEMLHMFISNRLGTARGGSSGRVVEGYEVRLLDEMGIPISGSGTGDLEVRGASMGYYYQPERGFLESPPRDWMRTGDVYERDEEGNFYFRGRSDDRFKIHGLWVAPLEIEEALMRHPAVLEAGVVAAQDADGLNYARAFVGLRAGQQVQAAALQEFTRAQLPSFKVPREILFLTSLPRTATGKLQRYKLRQLSPDKV